MIRLKAVLPVLLVAVEFPRTQWASASFCGVVDVGSGVVIGDCSEQCDTDSDCDTGTECYDVPSCNYYCGQTFQDAKHQCLKHCPGGTDTGCSSLGSTYRCFADTQCANQVVEESTDVKVSLNGNMGGTMGASDIAAFEATLIQFAADHIPDFDFSQVEVLKQVFSGGRRRRTMDVDGSGEIVDSRVMQTSSSALDVVVIITGAYRPPPFLNLDLLVEDSINADAEAFVEELKEVPTETNFFEQVESVEAVAIPDVTPDPTPSPTSSPSYMPSELPSNLPSGAPSVSPSSAPSASPGDSPSNAPSASPSDHPTGEPSSEPSDDPSGAPSVSPTGVPSLSPSDVPSSMPSRALVQSLSAFAQFGSDEYTTGSFGMLFNLRTTKDGPSVLISGMDFYTDKFSEVEYEVWTKEGTYDGFRGDFGAWTKIADGSVKGQGVDSYTSIPFDDFESVPIRGGGESRAIYFTLRSIDILYQMGDGLLSDELVQLANPELELYEGEGVISYPFRTESMWYRAPRKFLGTVWYDRNPCKPFSQDYPCPTKAPVMSTTSPSTTPSLSVKPSQSPFASPSSGPSDVPTISLFPSTKPSAIPSSSVPSSAPSTSSRPTREDETQSPTKRPTHSPTTPALTEEQETDSPTRAPHQSFFTKTPTVVDNVEPSGQTTEPSSKPTTAPPTKAPTIFVNQSSEEITPESTETPSLSPVSGETTVNQVDTLDDVDGDGDDSNSGNSSGIIIGMAVGGASLLALVIGSVIIIARGNWKKEKAVTFQDEKGGFEQDDPLPTNMPEQDAQYTDKSQSSSDGETPFQKPALPRCSSEERPFLTESSGGDSARFRVEAAVGDFGGALVNAGKDDASFSTDSFSQSAVTQMTRGQEPETFIGRRLSVRFTGNKFYPGVVTTYNHFTKKHRIQFDDGDVKDYNLSKKTIIWERANDAASAELNHGGGHDSLSSIPTIAEESDDVLGRRAIMSAIMNDETKTFQEKQESLRRLMGSSERELS